MAGRNEYLEHLANVPLFAGTSKRDLQRIARASSEILIPAGTQIVSQGEAGREFFLILDGTATVKRGNRKVATLGPGQFFGELALLDLGPRSATVTADTDMTVQVIGQKAFSEVLDNVPGLARRLLTNMARRLREADTRAVGH